VTQLAELVLELVEACRCPSRTVGRSGESRAGRRAAPFRTPQT
jgi:hypothetical protein